MHKPISNWNVYHRLFFHIFYVVVYDIRVIIIEFGEMMNIKKFLIGGIFFITANMVHALTLDQAVNQYKNKQLRGINAENIADAKKAGDDEPYVYKADTIQILKKDLNGDGILDYVVSLNYCEKTNCHLTTHVNEVAVFLGQKNKQVKFFDSISAAYQPDIKITKNNTIQVVDREYGDNDPSCCPSVKETRTYKIVKGELLRVH